MKPTVYKNFGNSIYLMFQEDETYDYFIRLHTGQIEVTRLVKEITAQMQVIPAGPFATPGHCAKIFLDSTLPKTDRATRILKLILEGEPLPNFVGLSDAPMGTVEPNAMTHQQKMQIIGDGALKIARKNPKPAPWAGEAPTDAPKPAKKGSSRRAADPNVVRLADICQELKIDPSDARKAIRAAGWTKPETGWAWPAAEAESIQGKLTELMK